MKTQIKSIIVGYLISFISVLPAVAVTNTFTATSGSNWSTTANWDQGHVPTDGEDVVLSGAATWDVATVPRIPATGTLGTITSSGAYGITVDISDAACHTADTTTNVCNINFTAATANTEVLFTITGTTDHNVGINGTTCTASSGTASKHCIYHNSSGGLVKSNVALVGGGVSSAAGARINGGGALFWQLKDVTGNTGPGIIQGANGSPVLTIKDGVKVVGGSVYNGYGIYNQITSAATIVLESGVKLENSAATSAIAGVFTWNATSGDASSWKIAHATDTNYWMSRPVTKGYISSGQYVVTPLTGTREEGTAVSGGGGMSVW